MPIDDSIPENAIRYYASLRSGGDFESIYASGQADAIVAYLSRMFFGGSSPPPGAVFEIADLPSLRTLDGKVTDDAKQNLNRLIVRVLTDENTWEKMHAAAARLGDKGELVGIGVDLPVYAARHWCPATDGGPFGDRSAAERLIGVEALRQAQPQLRGQGVNIALFDHGMDASKIPTQNFGGGWPGGTRPAGTTTENGHGMSMVRQILSVAPDALIFDYPILPPRITNVPTFLGEIEEAYQYLLADVAIRKGRWVAVNAWSTFSRAREVPAGSYSNNPNHLFNLKMTETVETGIDVVFAAGNCGQFCPDYRCGRKDRGPGSSIFGANSHPRVLTVGAVRSDGLWLGYSSQGEGQPSLERKKPDVCASSEFHETYDAGMIATGTSAACALAAGVIAALRSMWPAAAVSPDQLRGILTSTARKTEGAEWNGRFGHGILDAKAAFDAAVSVAPVT